MPNRSQIPTVLNAGLTVASAVFYGLRMFGPPATPPSSTNATTPQTSTSIILPVSSKYQGVKVKWQSDSTGFGVSIEVPERHLLPAGVTRFALVSKAKGQQYAIVQREAVGADDGNYPFIDGWLPLDCTVDPGQYAVYGMGANGQALAANIASVWITSIPEAGGYEALYVSATRPDVSRNGTQISSSDGNTLTIGAQC